MSICIVKVCLEAATVAAYQSRVTHICVSKLTIIGSDNGLSPGRRQAIIWTNSGILLIGALGTNVSEILIKICTFSLKKMLLKMSSGKRPPSCLGLCSLNDILLPVYSCVQNCFVLAHKKIHYTNIYLHESVSIDGCFVFLSVKRLKHNFHLACAVLTSVVGGYRLLHSQGYVTPWFPVEGAWYGKDLDWLVS